MDGVLAGLMGATIGTLVMLLLGFAQLTSLAAGSVVGGFVGYVRHGDPASFPRTFKYIVMATSTRLARAHMPIIDYGAHAKKLSAAVRELAHEAGILVFGIVLPGIAGIVSSGAALWVTASIHEQSGLLRYLSAAVGSVLAVEIVLSLLFLAMLLASYDWVHSRISDCRYFGNAEGHECDKDSIWHWYGAAPNYQKFLFVAVTPWGLPILAHVFVAAIVFGLSALIIWCAYWSLIHIYSRERLITSLSVVETLCLAYATQVTWLAVVVVVPLIKLQRYLHPLAVAKRTSWETATSATAS